MLFVFLKATMFAKRSLNFSVRFFSIWGILTSDRGLGQIFEEEKGAFYL
ncbi:hypothetical protein J2S07_000580 [Robertmurraya andreesenii]|uniref:Uncharacterized protein n=1 Tax=Anoxybacillus andreesenii TaxID=1325932 RepID=A0ABT9V012_9BACL|nr:hypothetical protein [Robertmurraya andreesenii]